MDVELSICGSIDLLIVNFMCESWINHLYICIELFELYGFVWLFMNEIMFSRIGSSLVLIFWPLNQLVIALSYCLRVEIVINHS